MKEQLKTYNRGYLANPLNTENQPFGKWTQNFSDIPNFRFPDVFFNYLQGKYPGITPKANKVIKLKIYKSLLGYHSHVSLLYYLQNLWAELIGYDEAMPFENEAIFNAQILSSCLGCIRWDILAKHGAQHL